MLFYLLATLLGALFTTAFAPLNFWFSALLLVPFFILVARSARAPQAFGLGFWFGFGFFALHMVWLPNSLSAYFGAITWAMYPPIVLIEGLFWGSVCWTARAAGGRGRGTLLLLPALWLMMEWARTQGAFAFPWGSIGYVWLGTPLAQFADLGGNYGLSLVTLIMAALLALPFVSGEVKTAYSSRAQSAAGGAFGAVLGAVILGLGVWGYGLLRLNEAIPPADQQALLVQGNTDPLGRAQGTTKDLEIYVRLTEGAMATAIQRPTLVIWPEGGISSEPLEGTAGEDNRLLIQAAAGEAEVITGAGVWESTQEGWIRYNSAYGLASATLQDRYDKVNLVPFGEGIPFLDQLKPVYDTIYSWFNLAAAKTLPGDTVKPIVLPDVTAAVYICYESVFPQVARQMVKQGGQVLVNISNDAWFGSGAGAEQHYQMGTMRAIETRRYLLRAGNDGITAAIDPLGRTLATIPRFAEGSLTTTYGLSDYLTPYVRLGDWVVWATLAYSLVALPLVFFRR